MGSTQLSLPRLLAQSVRMASQVELVTPLIYDLGNKSWSNVSMPEIPMVG
jgi:hypothetical protein